MARLPGYVGIGNVRYMTSGSMDIASLYRDMQPTITELVNKKIAISYNGNVVNVTQLREEISKSLSLEATSDTELLCKKLCLEFEKRGNMLQAVERFMKDVEGAYSIVGITGEGELFAFRDPLGIKPICIGFSEDKETVAIASESVGLDINGLNHFFDIIKPGELLRINDNNDIRRDQLIQLNRKAFCSFEFAYFSRPDSILDGTERYVYEIRQCFGKNLGKTCIQNGNINNLEIVIPVPETANDAGYGFHEESGLRLEQALRRHRYVTDRAFITVKGERNGIIERKINVLANKVFGKRIALIDDSIVRGDTTKSILHKMRAAGAKGIHIYVTFPKIISPCFYGVDMATFSELIGVKNTPTEIAAIIGADSVTYQKLEDFINAIGLEEKDLCLACLTGKYPTSLAQKIADEKKAEYEKGLEESKRIYE